MLDRLKKLNMKITPYKNDKVLYSFYDTNGQLLYQIEGNIPVSLKQTSDVGKYLYIKLNGSDFSKDGFQQRWVEIVLPYLTQLYNSSLQKDEEKEQKRQYEATKSKEEIIKEGEKVYNTIKVPLLYVKELADWLSAGETRNILYAFLCYVSQVVFKSGINVIIIGDAASGKNHIEEVGMGFIPEIYIIMEKNVTAAVIFRRSEQSPDFYDAKIVRYGDLGGTNDKEMMEASINLMKELQTEHYLNRPTNFPGGEGSGWHIQDLELIGTPAICFTTVPNAVIDSQVMSRGVSLMPRTDNQDEFFKRQGILGFNGKSKEYLDTVIREGVSNINNFVEYIKTIYDNIIFVNPYYESLKKLLEHSSFYKRDYRKYEVLLCTVAALQPDRIIEYKGKKFVNITMNDILLFTEIIHDYLDIATANVSKGAMNVLIEFNNIIQNQMYNFNEGFRDEGETLTKDEFLKKTTLNYNKSSITTYFSELLQMGYLETTDEKLGLKSVYKLSDKGLEFEQVNSIITQPTYQYEQLDAELIDIFIEKDKGENIKLFNGEYKYFKKPEWK